MEETTRELYEMYAKVHINPFFKNIKIKDIKPMQIQAFYNEKMKDIELENGKIKKGLSVNTIGKLHCFLNRAFEDAIHNRTVKYNPCQGVKKPKKKKYKPVICSEKSFDTLLEETKGTLDEVLILLAGICGLRRGEIFGLRFIDVDPINFKISIWQTKCRAQCLQPLPQRHSPQFLQLTLHNYSRSSHSPLPVSFSRYSFQSR